MPAPGALLVLVFPNKLGVLPEGSEADDLFGVLKAPRFIVFSSGFFPNVKPVDPAVFVPPNSDGVAEVAVGPDVGVL